MDAACAQIWGELPLAGHMHQLERLLMLDAQAPLQFDCLPSRASKSRSIVLVEGVKRSYTANPSAVGSLVQRVGAALKTDRMARTGMDSDVGIEADFDSLTRTIETPAKSAWRPRA
jgi:hypothetical protein